MSSCVVAGFDSPSAHVLIRVGFPTSALGMTQEMVWCGRTHNDDVNNQIDIFSYLCHCKTLCIFNERFYNIVEDGDRNDAARVIDFESQHVIQRRNLLKFLSLTCLSTTC